MKQDNLYQLIIRRKDNEFATYLFSAYPIFVRKTEFEEKIKEIFPDCYYVEVESEDYGITLIAYKDSKLNEVVGYIKVLFNTRLNGDKYDIYLSDLSMVRELKVIQKGATLCDVYDFWSKFDVRARFRPFVRENEVTDFCEYKLTDIEKLFGALTSIPISKLEYLDDAMNKVVLYIRVRRAKS